MKPAEAKRARERRRERGIEPRITRFAYDLVCKAIRHGRLKDPADFSCVDCGDPATTYDHRFYSRPLEVEPVCRSCNKKRGHSWDLKQLAAEAA